MPRLNRPVRRTSVKPKKVIRRPQDYILAGSSSTPSAKLLRDAIEKITGRRYLVTHKEGLATNCIARYGGVVSVSGSDSGMNSVERIALLGSKSRFAALCIQNNIPAPEFHNSGVPTTFPVLIRTTLTSFGGKGIILCQTSEEFARNWRPGYWWVPFYRFSNEYRVHVAGGQILRVFEKVREDGLEPETHPIRNSERGYHFSIRNRPQHGESIRQTVTAIAQIPVLSQGFFALDLGWDRDNRRMYVIEGNSAPGLNESTALLYANYIVESTGLTRLPGVVLDTLIASIDATVPAPAVSTASVANVQVQRPTPVVRQPVAENPSVATPRPAPTNPAREVIIPGGVNNIRRETANEVLRPETNTAGTRLPNTSPAGRTEHEHRTPSPERTREDDSGLSYFR